MSFTRRLSQLDPDPRLRGREFERISAWYLRNAPEYRGRFKRVWLWADWPEAWAPDAGIDLVAEQHGGGLWAIQAKAYDENYAIKKRDVDSFLAEAGRPQFSYRLLIATTDPGDGNTRLGSKLSKPPVCRSRRCRRRTSKLSARLSTPSTLRSGWAGSARGNRRRTCRSADRAQLA